MAMLICGALAACALAASQAAVPATDPLPVVAQAAPAPPATDRGSVALMAAPLVAAHRGGFFHHQGSLARIDATLAQAKADILEIDLRSTSDGTVVVYHDPLLQSKSDCSGAVVDQPYSRLASCRLRSSGDPLPLFSDVLRAARGRAVVDAEFKTAASVAPAIDVAESHDDLDGVYFQVGNDRDLYRLARADSSAANLQFKATSDDDIQWALSLHDPHLRIIEMDRDFITPARISEIHLRDRLVSENTWRYQYTEERFGSSCGRAFMAGVDIAVTNNPASCSRQRYSRRYSTLHRWVYSTLGRPHVRSLARRFDADARTAAATLEGFVDRLKGRPAAMGT